MKQILVLAYKLLVNDKGKYTALLVGTTFSGAAAARHHDGVAAAGLAALSLQW
jgi:hypothetical protein